MRDTTNSDDPGTRESESRTIQAGAIAFRADGGSPRILLVRARKSPDAWVFPEGDRFRDLMIAEFEHVAASLLSNEESGEKRVSAFLAVSGVVGSALGFLIGKESPFDVHKQIVAIFVLAVLLLFGYGTFRRIIV